VPNVITLVRVVLVPFLWVFSFMHLNKLVGYLAIVAFLSDALDGPVARRMKLENKFGARFDNFADVLLVLSAVLLIVLFPDFIFSNFLWFIIPLGLFVVALIVIFIRTGCLLYFHLYSEKITFALFGIFSIHALLFEPSIVLLCITAVFGVITSIEMILLVLTDKKADHNTKSFFFRK